MILFAALACAPFDPAAGTDPPEIVNLRIRAYVPEITFVPCAVTLDRVFAGGCDEWRPTSPEPHVTGVGDPADLSDDGLPLVRAPDASVWVSAPMPVDLGLPGPFPRYGDGYSSDDGTWWTATHAVNRYVGGRWDCASDRGGALSDAAITVADGGRLVLPEEMWNSPHEIRVVGSRLETEAEPAVYWTPGEDHLVFGAYGQGDGDGDGTRWTCARPS